MIFFICVEPNFATVYFIVEISSSFFGSGLPCNTSSTAQGGGGSFKNRKPIGEVGCCESGMESEATDGAKGD